MDTLTMHSKPALDWHTVRTTVDQCPICGRPTCTRQTSDATTPEGPLHIEVMARCGPPPYCSTACQARAEIRTSVPA